MSGSNFMDGGWKPLQCYDEIKKPSNYGVKEFLSWADPCRKHWPCVMTAHDVNKKLQAVSILLCSRRLQEGVFIRKGGNWRGGYAFNYSGFEVYWRGGIIERGV